MRLVHLIALEEEGGAQVAHHADGGLGHGVLHGFEHGLCRVEEVHGVLAEVADVDVGPDRDAAGGRLGLAGQHLEKGGFAGAVHADHGDLLLPPDHAARRRRRPIFWPPSGRGQTLPRLSRRHHIITAARRLGKLEPDDLLLRRQLDALDLLDLLHPRLHLGGMGGAGGEAGDELLLLGQHLLLAAVAGQQLLAPDLPFAQVKVVVAAVGGDGAGWPPR